MDPPAVTQNRAAATATHTATGTLRDPIIPEFTGEEGKSYVKPWLARMELELYAHGIPEAEWPIHITRRFAIGLSAQSWAQATYLRSTTSRPQWGDFRSALLAQFGSLTERLEAESGWINLHLAWTSDPI